MKKNLLIITVSIFCLAVASCAHQNGNSADALNFPPEALPDFSTPVTREELRQAYYKYSAPAIVKKLRENDAANWDMLMGKVSAGDADWIPSVAAYVFPGTDAAATTDVIVSLAYGLPENPEAVLSLEFGLHISMLSVCGVPFIEPEYDFVTNYGKNTLEALRKVNKPYLIDSRDTCIRRLHDGLAHARKAHAEGRWE